MDLLFYGLGGECGFYDAAPQGTLLQEASHRSTLGRTAAERLAPGDATPLGSDLQRVSWKGP